MTDCFFKFHISHFIVFWWLLLRKKDRHQRILLMGCSNGGKTALFSQLNFGKSFPTYMSMKENVGQVANDKVSLYSQLYLSQIST